MKTITIEIAKSEGSLFARLEVAASSEVGRFAIFAPCFSGTSNFNAMRPINSALTNQGFGVVRFDLTGLGCSSGKLTSSTVIDTKLI